VPTKSTATGTTTFPVLATGTIPYACYFEDYVDRECGECPLCLLDVNNTHYEPGVDDVDRRYHLSGSHNRNYPSYSCYFEDCVDREGGERPFCPLDRYHTHDHPTKSTPAGTTTFPVLATGTYPSYSCYSESCVNRKVMSVSSVLWLGKHSRSAYQVDRNYPSSHNHYIYSREQRGSTSPLDPESTHNHPSPRLRFSTPGSGKV
jgi:hypothetical protein